MTRIGEHDVPDLVRDDTPERAAQIDRPDLRVAKQGRALGYQQRVEQLFRFVVVDMDWHVVDPVGHQARAAEHDPRPGPARSRTILDENVERPVCRVARAGVA